MNWQKVYLVFNLICSITTTPGEKNYPKNYPQISNLENNFSAEPFDLTYCNLLLGDIVLELFTFYL
jgi:hypothetical protein